MTRCETSPPEPRTSHNTRYISDGGTVFEGINVVGRCSTSRRPTLSRRATLTRQRPLHPTPCTLNLKLKFSTLNSKHQTQRRCYIHSSNPENESTPINPSKLEPQNRNPTARTPQHNFTLSPRATPTRQRAQAPNLRILKCTR